MRTDRLPLVSVFMPCFNQEQYVSAAIESVLAQDFQDLELVVVDDCSTDGTWNIVESYRQKWPDRVLAFRNERNLGITSNCNKILGLCSGKYIAFHAGDDLYLPGKLSAQVAAMESERAVLCYHDIEVFDSSTGRVLSCWNSGPGSNKPLAGDSLSVAWQLVAQGTAFMAALSVMVRKDAIPAWGFDVRIRVASDWMLWIDACMHGHGPVVFLPRLLARYRRHETNVTSLMRKYFDDELITLALVEARYPELLPAIERARGRLQYRAAINHLIAGRNSVARTYLLRAIWHPDYTVKSSLRLIAAALGIDQGLAKVDPARVPPPSSSTH